MVCPECGKQLKDSAAFCKFCGSRVQGESRNSARRSRRRGRGWIIPAIVGLTVFIIALTATVLIINGRKRDSSEARIEASDASQEMDAQSAMSTQDDIKEEGSFSTENTAQTDIPSYIKGDIITFGKYEQDGDTSNGAEPIEWEVLDSDADGVLVISKYILDAKPYHNQKNEDVTWETCTLRAWLNNEFYNYAFSAPEQTEIITSEVMNNDNETLKTEGGNDTYDNVFILSLDEIEKYYKVNCYDKEPERNWGWYSEELIADVTEYIIANDLLYAFTLDHRFYEDTNDMIDKWGGQPYSESCIGRCSGGWWLRTPGGSLGSACAVEFDGYAGVGCNVDYDKYGIRPAMRIDFENVFASEEAQSEENISDVINDEYDMDAGEPASDETENESITKDYKTIKKFDISGKWKNIGEGTYGQVGKGTVVVFDGVYCNVYSPQDTYAFYQDGDDYVLECTGLLSSSPIVFTVKTVDKNNIDLYHGSNVLELTRVE